MLQGRADEVAVLAALAGAAGPLPAVWGLGTVTDRREAVMLAARAEAAALDGRATDALRFGHAALPRLDRAHAHDALPQALIGIGLAHDLDGRARAARQVLTRARRIARQRGLDDWELKAVDHQLELLIREAPLHEAEEALGDAIGLAAGRGSTYEGLWRLRLARLHIRAGNLDASVELAEEVLRGGGGSPELECSARALLAELRYECDEVEAGMEVLEPALSQLDAAAEPRLAEAMRASAALLAAATDDCAATWQHAEELTTLAERTPGACAPARVISDLAATGADVARLRRLWSRVRARAHAGDAAWPAHVDGALEEAAGDLAAAANAYAQSVSADEGKRGRLHLAAGHIGLARTLSTTGSGADARRHARQALQLLVRADGWRRSEARRLCARPDPPSRPLRRAADELLSAREREVAALVATGLSNPEIAERLFIAPKTASAHVSHILTKLGFRSRTEVAAWAALEGLVTLDRDGLRGPPAAGLASR